MTLTVVACASAAKAPVANRLRQTACAVFIGQTPIGSGLHAITCRSAVPLTIRAARYSPDVPTIPSPADPPPASRVAIVSGRVLSAGGAGLPLITTTVVPKGVSSNNSLANVRGRCTQPCEDGYP